VKGKKIIAWKTSSEFAPFSFLVLKPKIKRKGRYRLDTPPLEAAQHYQVGTLEVMGSCHKRQKTQALTPQAPIRNRQTRKVANAKGLNHNTNLT